MNGAFVVQQTKVMYLMEPVTPEQAEAVGCPGAEAKLVGRNGYIFGSLAPVTGREVRVPGWTAARKGVLAVFTPWGAPETGEPMKGWMAW